MRILGIDPGLNTTGYAVLDCSGNKVSLLEAGAIRSRASGDLGGRLDQIYSGLKKFVHSGAPRSSPLKNSILTMNDLAPPFLWAMREA
ncbi:MAG: crossover junction endodeoxyribonuclease RuvC [Pirellulales bacterium]